MLFQSESISSHLVVTSLDNPLTMYFLVSGPELLVSMYKIRDVAFLMNIVGPRVIDAQGLCYTLRCVR